jgi:hypothetical protein
MPTSQPTAKPSRSPSRQLFACSVAFGDTPSFLIASDDIYKSGVYIGANVGEVYVQRCPSLLIIIDLVRLGEQGPSTPISVLSPLKINDTFSKTKVLFAIRPENFAVGIYELRLLV